MVAKLGLLVIIVWGEDSKMEKYFESCLRGSLLGCNERKHSHVVNSFSNFCFGCERSIVYQDGMLYLQSQIYNLQRQINNLENMNDTI